MTPKLLIAVALTLLLSFAARAQESIVWMDTDNGPIVLRLDPVNAPITTQNFVDYVNAGFYDNMIFHRVVPNFVVQAGLVDGNGQVRQATGPTISSERDNGLDHLSGTIAMALNGNPPDVNSGQAQFFINLVENADLNADFTVFGEVIYGRSTLLRMNGIPSYTNQVPIRPTLIRRAVHSDGFPIMNLHTGSWYDPQNPRRGFVVEVANDVSSDQGPIVVVYWYDYLNGQQLWATGSASFEYGASEVDIPLIRIEGGQFGPAFDPNAVVIDDAWGTLNLKFFGCDQGRFRFSTILGTDDYYLTRLTIPSQNSCLEQ
ncbi:MAG: peptidylprolyl isomerase [Xanthomonadales bacterium]|nr:peptidylprolyl isomerase [Xanthomonadales bacterium]